MQIKCVLNVWQKQRIKVMSGLEQERRALEDRLQTDLKSIGTFEMTVKNMIQTQVDPITYYHYHMYSYERKILQVAHKQFVW